MKNFISKFWWLISGVAGIMVVNLLWLIYPSEIAFWLFSFNVPIIYLSYCLKSETFLIISSIVYTPAIQFLLGVVFGAIIKSFITGGKEKRVIQNIAFDKKKSIFAVLFLPTILLIVQVILFYWMSYYSALGGWDSIAAAFIFPSVVITGILNILLSIAKLIRNKITVIRIILIIYIIFSAIISSASFIFR